MAAFDGPGSRRIPLPAVPRKKQYKARIENPWNSCHAIEVWFEGTSIIEAGQAIMEKFASLGVSAAQVTKLIEVDS
jgi:hypothetical protein